MFLVAAPYQSISETARHFRKQKKPYETSPRAPAKDRLHLSTLEVLRRNRSTSPGLTDLHMIKYLATFHVCLRVDDGDFVDLDK